MDGLAATRIIKHRWLGPNAFLLKGCAPEALLETILSAGK